MNLQRTYCNTGECEQMDKNTYKLSCANIADACQMTKQYLVDNKIDNNEIIRVLMMLEETLLKYQERFGEDKDFSVRTGKFFRTVRIALHIEGESYDPFIGKNDSDLELSRHATASSTGLSFDFSYKNSDNIIWFTYTKKFKISTTVATLIAIVLAVIVGLICLQLPQDVNTILLDDYVSPILDKIMAIIAAVAGPTVFFSLIGGVGAIGDVDTLSKIGKRMLICFLIELLILSVIASIVCTPFFEFASDGTVSFQFSTILDLLLDIIPSNMFTPFTEGNIQQMILLAIVLGIAMLILGEKVSYVSKLASQMNNLIQYVMKLITVLIPVMVFLSIFKIVLKNQLALILKAYKLIPLCLGIALLFMLIYTLIIAIKHKVGIITLIKKAWPVFIIGLTTSSSATALTKNLETSERLFGIDKKIVSFGVPVGQTLFRPGEVMRYVILGFVMAEMYSVQITVGWVIILIVISFLLSVATPPVAGGASVCLAVLFQQMAIPEDALGFAVAINIILGFLLTAVSLYCLQMELTRLAGSLDLLDKKVLQQNEES